MDTPPDSDPGELTRFLQSLGGDEEIGATLMPVVYGELKRIAEAFVRTQRRGHTLQPTALVNEAYLKLFAGHRPELADRKHFFRLAARAMRQLLIDHARARGRDKRGGDQQPVTLDEALVGPHETTVDWLDLDLALVELGELDQRQAEVVELRYFGGLEVEEVAQVLEVSRSTVEREWRAARAWLGVRLAR